MIGYNGKNLTLARNLRKNMTPWERKLWFEFLRTFKHKFYTQRRIGNYILDFYCAKHKIAIELDGGQHYSSEGVVRDAERTKYLNSLGIKVLRYSNLDVDKHFNNVCDDIINHFS